MPSLGRHHLPFNGKIGRTCTQLSIGPQQLGTFEVLEIADSSFSRQVPLLDYSNSLSLIPFTTAWDWQKALLNDHVERLSQKKSTSQFLQGGGDLSGLDTVIMLQHYPVYTLGTGSDEKCVLSSDDSVPVIRMDR
jgi:lipoate-protein ligase B